MSVRIAYTNLLTASGVTITSSADATGYPASNLSNPARWKKWRSSTTTGDQWVKFDLGANTTFTLLAAISAKLHSGGGTLKAQAHASDAWGAPTVNDTLTVPSPDFTAVLADWIASQSLRWIRFYFTNVGAVSDYVELGAVFAGVYYQPTKIAPGLKLTRIDQSVNRRALGGQRSAVVRPKYHKLNGILPLQTAAARDSWRTAFESVGGATPAIFTADHATPGLTFYGALAVDLALNHNGGSPAFWDVAVDFTEDVP